MRVRLGTKNLQKYGSDFLKPEQSEACLCLWGDGMKLLHTSCSTTQLRKSETGPHFLQ